MVKRVILMSPNLSPWTNGISRMWLNPRPMFLSNIEPPIKPFSLSRTKYLIDISAMDKYKQTADSYLAVSEGAPDPVIWFENVMKVERESLLKANVKNQELTKKIASLEKERNDSVVKNAKIEKSILDAKKQAESATKGEKYSSVIFCLPVPMKFFNFFFCRNEKGCSF